MVWVAQAPSSSFDLFGRYSDRTCYVDTNLHDIRLIWLYFNVAELVSRWILSSSVVALFFFCLKQKAIEVSIVYEVFDGSDSPEIEFSAGSGKTADREQGPNFGQGGGVQSTQSSEEKVNAYLQWCSPEWDSTDIL